MAKKVRTPPPPRRVQAPKRRETAAPADAQRRQRMILYAVAASGILLLLAVVAFLAFAPSGNGENEEELARTIRSAGGTFQTFESEGRTHVNDLNAKVDYKTDPPTSGPHYAVPAFWDVYDRPINELQAVHNLEHGGIVIQYGNDVPQSEVRKIEAFYREDPNGMLVAPLPHLGDQIALTAWTHLAKLPRFDEEAFKAFRDTYRGRGPEGFSVESLQPGGT